MDRAWVERFLKMVDRHIVEGDRILTRQMDLIARMKTVELDTTHAEAFLIAFQKTQLLHYEHRDIVLRDAYAKGPKGERCPADVISNAVKVMRIATGEDPEDAGPADDGKD